MKMLVVVYGKMLEEGILKLLEENEVKAYSEVPRVFGSGEAGRVEDSRHYPGMNASIFVALPEEKIAALSAAFREFLKLKHDHGRPVPLRVFSIPCEQLV